MKGCYGDFEVSHHWETPESLDNRLRKGEPVGLQVVALMREVLQAVLFFRVDQAAPD